MCRRRVCMRTAKAGTAWNCKSALKLAQFALAVNIEGSRYCVEGPSELCAAFWDEQIVGRDERTG